MGLVGINKSLIGTLVKLYLVVVNNVILRLMEAAVEFVLRGDGGVYGGVGFAQSTILA